MAIGAFLLCIAYLPKVTSSSFPTENAVLLVLGAAGLPFLAARAIGGPGASRDPDETWAARLAVAFVVIGAVSAAFAAEPLLAIFGLYVHLAGWLFMVALAGCWALGTGFADTDRRWLELAIIGGALVNAVVAVLQQLVGLSALGFPDYQGLPDGLLGNPVFLSALLAGSVALVVPRFLAAPRRWWWVLVAICAALGTSGERLSALLAVVVAAYALWRAWGARADDDGGHGAWRRSEALAGLVVGSLLVGSLLARVRGGVGVVNRTASSNVSATFGQRLEYWWLALRAIVHRPLVGYGPDQFRAATSPLVSTSFAKSQGVNYPFTFLDAHNFVIEYATTIGVIGAAVLVAWLVLGARHRRGPLLGFALVLLVIELAEPLDLVVTPLALLALGAAGLSAHQSGVQAAEAPAARGASGRSGAGGLGWVRPTSVVLAVLAAGLTVVLLVGDFAYQGGFNDTSSSVSLTTISAALNSEKRASSLLFAWPDPATVNANLYASLAAAGVSGSLPQAATWGQTAVDRDPTNGPDIGTLAQYQLELGEDAAAARNAHKAVREEPWNTTALNILGTLAALDRHQSAAQAWFRRSLALDPTQSQVRRNLEHLEDGCRAGGSSPAPQRCGSLARPESVPRQSAHRHLPARPGDGEHQPLETALRASRPWRGDCYDLAPCAVVCSPSPCWRSSWGRAVPRQSRRPRPPQTSGSR